MISLNSRIFFIDNLTQELNISFYINEKHYFSTTNTVKSEKKIFLKAKHRMKRLR